MKCAKCEHAVYDRFFSIAIGTAVGVFVANWCTDCFDDMIGRPQRRKLEQVVMHNGWVQESLPI